MANIWYLKCPNILYSSPDTITVVTSEWFQWVGHVAKVEKNKLNLYRVMVGETSLKSAG
jgi:hypothetical protein